MAGPLDPTDPSLTLNPQRTGTPTLDMAGLHSLLSAPGEAGKSLKDMMYADILRQQGIFADTFDPRTAVRRTGLGEKGTDLLPLQHDPWTELPVEPQGVGAFGADEPGIGGLITRFKRGAQAFGEGIYDSPFGKAFQALVDTVGPHVDNYKSLRWAASQSDPSYDPWRDEQIEKAGLTSQMHLFAGSQNAATTGVLIRRYQDNLKLSDWLQRGGAGVQGPYMGGQMLMDPANFLPAVAWSRGLQLAVRGRQGLLTGAELAQLSVRPAVFGAIADGLANAAVQGSFMIAENALIHALDPTVPGDISADLVLPTALAGSIGLVTGVMSRWEARSHAAQIAQAGYMAPPGARPSGFEGRPGGIRPEEPPPGPAPPSNGGNFPPGSLNTDYGPMRTKEQMADPHSATVKPMPPERVGRLDHELPADAQGARELLLNGEMRSAAEFETGHKMVTPSGEVWQVIPVRGVKRFEKVEMGLTEATSARPIAENTSPDYRGIFSMKIDGEWKTPNEFETGTHFVTPNGTVWEVAESKLEGSKSKFFRTVSELRKEVGPGARLVDREFKPGELGAEVALPPELPPDRRFGREPVGYNAQGEALYQRADGSRTVVLENGNILEEPINDLGKERGQLFGGEERMDRFRLADEAAAPVLDTAKGTAGAALNPASQLYQQSVLLAQGRMAPTGIGLEKLPLNPVFRAFRGMSVAMMNLVTDLVSTGGMQTIGNRIGAAFANQPVETLIDVNWKKPMTDILRSGYDHWSAYREKVAGAGQGNVADYTGRSDVARKAAEVGAALKDKITPGETPLSFAQFRERVGRALNNGDRDRVSDAATPYIEAHAAEQRGFYERIKTEAADAGVFDEAHQAARDQAYSDVQAVKREADKLAIRQQMERQNFTGSAVDRTAMIDRHVQEQEALLPRMEDAEFKTKQLEQKLADLKANGPLLNGTAPSYRPRVYRVDKLLEGEQQFVDIISSWLERSPTMQLDRPEAVRIAKQIHELLSKQEPIYDRGDLEALFKSVATPGSAMARSLTIPDNLIDQFLEHDSEALLRHQTKQMASAIEMKKRFGNLDLSEQIEEVRREYHDQIEAAKSAGNFDEAERLRAMQKGAIVDAQALRDKIYGTYGASPDPQRWTSRSIRMAKVFNNLTLMGMSGITALGDLVRPLMTEGIDSFYGYGLRTLMSDARATILKLNKDEMELAGNGMELINNTRALGESDTGDVFAGKTRFERGMNQANSWMFMANGLNMVNEIDKQWANLIVGGHFHNALLDLEAGAPAKFQAELGRYGAVGIDEVIGRRIAIQLKIHGIDFGSGGNALTIANTGAWTDEYAREVYRGAMNQLVNRTVPTPGKGDTPNFMSTELGGLLTQYKSFAVGALQRGALSGLQDGGNRFWFGAAAAVGFAAILNEIRSQLFYDKSTADKPMPAIIVDAVDRSGLLGWFSDVDRALETLSGHRVGTKAMLGAEHPVAPSFTQVAGIGGPAVQQAARTVSVANDFLSNHPTATTFRNWRALVPGQNLPYLDPAMDALFNKGGVLPGVIGTQR